MNGITVITGRRGKGKTSLAYHLAKQSGRGVVVFDPTEAFGIGAITHDQDSFEAALDREEQSPVVWQIENAIERPDAVVEDCGQFASTVKHFQNIAVIYDETSYLQSPQWIAPGLDDQVRVGRRRKHEVFLTLHRMSDCNGVVLDLVTQFKMFATKNPKSLARIAEYCGDAVAGEVSQLKDFEFVDYNVDRGLWCVNNFPQEWKVDVSGERPPARISAERFARAA